MGKITVFYYAMPGQVAKDKMPDLGTLGIAFNCMRYLRANRERGYMGLSSCNWLAEWAFWHYPCEFLFNSRGI